VIEMNILEFADPESEKMLTARRRVEILAQRSGDDELRRLTTSARESIDMALAAGDSSTAFSHVGEASRQQQLASDRAGELLRNYL
jgi:hypothetical protein